MAYPTVDVVTLTLDEKDRDIWSNYIRQTTFSTATEQNWSLF